MFGKAWSGEPRTFYHFMGQQLRAVRQGPWKLHVGKSDDMKLEVPALFNLHTDLGESTNLAAEHPQIVAELQALAEKVRDDLGDTLTKRAGNNLRPPGKLHP
jgi:arylsulfatase A